MDNEKELEKDLQDDLEDDKNKDYIEAIKDLKKNTVPKEDYESLKAENKKLLQAVIDGDKIDLSQTENKQTIKDLKEELFKNDLTNLDFCKKALELRSSLMAEGKGDPFLPTGKSVPLTEDDYSAVDRVVDVLEQCIEAADGDPHVFNLAFQKRLQEPSILSRRR